MATKKTAAKKTAPKKTAAKKTAVKKAPVQKAVAKPEPTHEQIAELARKYFHEHGGMALRPRKTGCERSGN